MEKNIVEIGDWVSLLFHKPIFSINNTDITGINIITAVCILVAAYVTSLLVKRAFGKVAVRVGLDSSTVFTLNKVLHYCVVLLGLMIAMSTIGLDLSKIALLMSAVGVGLGFGLQAIINNFVSGIIVMFERTLKIGDCVELESGVTGVVTAINLRSTIVTTNDNIDILVPNSEFVNQRFINWTLYDRHKRLRIPFGVAYGSDMELVKKAALEAADSVSCTTERGQRKTQVWLVAFGDSSLNCELVVWVSGEAVNKPIAIKAAYTWALEASLRKYHIEIPFPQRDLHLRGFFEKSGEDALEALRKSQRPEFTRSSFGPTQGFEEFDVYQPLGETERGVLQENDALGDVLKKDDRASSRNEHGPEASD